jgi:hypothetical protein
MNDAGQIQDKGAGNCIQHTVNKMHDTDYRNKNSRCRIQNTRHKSHGTVYNEAMYKIHGTESKISYSGYRAQKIP